MSLALAGWAALAGPAGAADAAAPGGMNAEALLILEVVVLVVLGRLLGEIMYRLGQPTIMGQILAGVLVGPTVLGALWPQGEAFLFPRSPEQAAMINGVSQLGILFLLLLAGMETDLGLAYRLRKAALSVSFTGIAVPFACGFVLGLLMPADLLPESGKRLVTALFLGTALSISSLKIVATVVREMNFMRRNVGQLIVASAVIDDTAGWVIIAITLGLATKGAVDLPSLAITVVGTVVFLALALTIGRRLTFELIRWANDSFHSDLPVTTAIVGLMGVLALITATIGVQTVLGAFVAGLLIGQSPILTRQIDEQLRGLTTALFMPVFFGLTGAHADLRVLADPHTAALTLGLVLIASLGKFGGAFLGARFNGMTRNEALALGFGMNARGSTEVIVASIGLSVGVLDQRLFSVIVTMAIITTLAMPPTLRWALGRLPIKDEEKQRLEREQFEDESFVGNLERILLVADRSDASSLASTLAGHIGGLRNMPVTVLDASGETEQFPFSARQPINGGAVDEWVVRQVRASSESAIATAQQADEMRDKSLPVASRPSSADLAAAVTAEAEKGHDLGFIGIEPTVDEEGHFDRRVDSVFNAFKRATAIVAARGGLRRPGEQRLRLLVPVSGDVWSMRAMEFAVLLAKASGAHLAALYVRPEARRYASFATERTAPHLGVFERIRAMARHYEIEIATILDESHSPEISILSQARRHGYNLIILGVGRRAGDRLSFGGIADTLLETSDRSLLFFASA